MTTRNLVAFDDNKFWYETQRQGTHGLYAQSQYLPLDKPTFTEEFRAWLGTRQSFVVRALLGSRPVRFTVRYKKPRGKPSGSWVAQARIRGRVRMRYVSCFDNMVWQRLDRLVEEFSQM